MAWNLAARADRREPTDADDLSAGVFAGGDCVFGPRLIIDSVADGKRAAVGIDEFLSGTSHPEHLIEIEVLERQRMPLNLLDLVRPPAFAAGAAQPPHRGHRGRARL